MYTRNSSFLPPPLVFLCPGPQPGTYGFSTLITSSHFAFSVMPYHSYTGSFVIPLQEYLLFSLQFLVKTKCTNIHSVLSKISFHFVSNKIQFLACFHLHFMFSPIFYHHFLLFRAFPTPRLFVPAMSCPTCHYANDHTFWFFQNCGYSRCCVNTPVPTAVTFNLSAIDKRINFLQSNHLSTAYLKQKQFFKTEFKSFLFALPGKKKPFRCHPWMFVASWCLRIPKVNNNNLLLARI